MNEKELSFFYWGFVSIICAVFMMGFMEKTDDFYTLLFFVLFLFSFMAFGYTMKKLQEETKNARQAR